MKLSLGGRSFMSVRERPSHSRMFDKNGNVIPIPEETKQNNYAKKALVVLLALAAGLRVFYMDSIREKKAKQEKIES